MLRDVILDPPGVVGARAEVVALSGHDVDDAHADDDIVACQADHAADTVRLTPDVGAGPVDRIDREPDVQVRVSARNHQWLARNVALFADDAEGREPLTQLLDDDALGFLVCVGDPVGPVARLSALFSGLEVPAHDTRSPGTTSRSLLDERSERVSVHAAVDRVALCRSVLSWVHLAPPLCYVRSTLE